MSELTLDKPSSTTNGTISPKMVRTVFLAEPEGSDTSAVRHAFHSRGVQCFSADQVDLPGQRLPQILREGLAKADVVVAVVDNTAASNTVFFELGLAQGLNKPMAILLSADASTWLWQASGIPYFRYHPEMPGTLEFCISQILTLAHASSKPIQPPRLTHSIGERANELLTNLRMTDSSLPRERAQEIIGEALRESGVTTIAEGTDPSVHLVVWSDDLSPWIGTPLPIAVCLTPECAPGPASESLTQAMTQRNMRWGLLLHAHPESIPIRNSRVLQLTAEEFLRQLRTTSFADIVRDLRNRHLHGGG